MKRYFRLASALAVLPGCASLALASGRSDFHAHVPAGWLLLSQTQGDLNGDGGDDAVLVLEKDDPANRKPNPGLGAAELNLNPRRLVILFQTADGHKEALAAERFLATENDADSPCLADPLEDGEIRIVRNTLRIRLNHWLSCGGWGTSQDEYIFRHENGRFGLIGRDHSQFARNSGQGSEYSVNYLTGKVKITSGLNEFEETKPRVAWKSVGNAGPFYLDALSPADVPGEVED